MRSPRTKSSEHILCISFFTPSSIHIFLESFLREFLFSSLESIRGPFLARKKLSLKMDDTMIMKDIAFDNYFATVFVDDSATSTRNMAILRFQILIFHY